MLLVSVNLPRLCSRLTVKVNQPSRVFITCFLHSSSSTPSNYQMVHSVNTSLNVWRCCCLSKKYPSFLFYNQEHWWHKCSVEPGVVTHTTHPKLPSTIVHPEEHSLTIYFGILFTLDSLLCLSHLSPPSLRDAYNLHLYSSGKLFIK